MDKWKGKYRREPVRNPYWDYSTTGSYFITINVEGRANILCSIENGKVHLSEYGDIVKAEFLKMESYHPRVMLKEWIIMPDHVHCLISLGGQDFDNKVAKDQSIIWISKFASISKPVDNPTETQLKEYRRQRRRMIIPKIIGKFKQQTSKYINIKRNTIGQKFWMHDYDDRIIRSEGSFQRVRRYIVNNPLNWK